MKSVLRTGLATAVLVAGWAGIAEARSPMLRELEDSFVRLHEEVRPVVVNIDTRGPSGASLSQGPSPDMENLDEFFKFFGIPFDEQNPNQQPFQPPQARATGSGFIFDSQGHIVTNNHVVDGAERISVKLWNGNEYDAEVVGTDPDTDLAVIKINANEELPVAKLGDSDRLRVGQFAIALGSPRGFEGSLSFGHISALGRENLAGLAAQGLRFQNLVQTDAAINLGNSGGPLCNIDGEVVGINIAIVWGANSLGFAIPVNTAKDIVPQLIADGHVTRGYLGVGIVDASEYAESLNLPDGAGAFVKKVQEGTPAERAGIEVYDVIRKINGEVVQDATDLVRKVSSIEPGKDVEVEVWRNESPTTLDVMLDEWQPKQAEAPQSRSVLGVDVRALNPEMAQRLGLPEGQSGVLVTSVEPGSPAEEAGLQHGDIIMEVAREQVNSPEQFREVLSREAQPGQSVLIRYMRQGGEADITVLRVPAAE
jgi:serine protease Do